MVYDNRHLTETFTQFSVDVGILIFCKITINLWSTIITILLKYHFMILFRVLILLALVKFCLFQANFFNNQFVM